MADYETELGDLPSEVSFGVATIRIAKPDCLKLLQVGCGIDSRGMPLIGEAEGDWRATWVVIGSDDTSGDPIFIDTAIEGFPVYTAMHGAGRWRPTRIASNLTGLKHALGAVSDAARGRENPIALGTNPLTPRERTEVLSRIREYNRDVDLGFWIALLDAS
jgi:hypothetical protein